MNFFDISKGITLFIYFPNIWLNVYSALPPLNGHVIAINFSIKLFY